MTLIVLYSCDAVAKHIIHKRMMEYSLASFREDGIPNRVVMNGKPGYLGDSSVRLEYLKDGWISLKGNNVGKSNVWKLLSTFALEPGTYTLTGLKGQDENTIALQLRIENDTGVHRYLYQYDEDVSIIIEKQVDVALHVRVYPEVDGIDVRARPAVYRDE